MSKFVLWQNHKYSIESYLTVDERINIVVVKDKIYTDFPIMYESGIIAYDRPEKLPKYVKNKVEKIWPILRKNNKLCLT